MRGTRLLLPLFLCAISLSAAASPRVHFVLSTTAEPYMELLHEARGMLDGVAEVSHGPVGSVDDDVDVIVTLGVMAAQAYVPRPDPRPVFSALVPMSTWHGLPHGTDGQRTALFLDQPYRRQVAMVRAVLPPTRDLGIVLGPVSESAFDGLESAVREGGMRVHAARATGADDDAVAAVTAVLRRSDALLAVPDPAVYNRFTVQGVLLTGFRMRRPVFGFSHAWVTAGALAAVHTTAGQAGTELGGMIVTWLEHPDALPPPRNPSLFTLSVNREVAHALGLALPMDEVLRRRLDDLEGAP